MDEFWTCDGWLIVREGERSYALQRETWDRSLFEGSDVR